MPRLVGYNVQTAVEADHPLIVAHEVTMLGFDRDALSMMATAVDEVMTTDQLTTIADKGYYKGEEIVASEEAGMSVVVPKPSRLLQAQLLLTQHFFACAAVRISQRSDFHQSGH